jgi:DNA-directed RNA polymerase beta' subunit
VAKIDVGQTYENGRPKMNGLSDPRLGTMDRALKCTTDGANQQDSPGYFGHIELAKPVYHIGFLTTVVKVLRCVSYHSSKLLVDKVCSSLAKIARSVVYFQGHATQCFCAQSHYCSVIMIALKRVCAVDRMTPSTSRPSVHATLSSGCELS